MLWSVLATVALGFSETPAHAFLEDTVDALFKVSDGCGAVDSARARARRYRANDAAHARCYLQTHDPVGVAAAARATLATAQDVEDMVFLKEALEDRVEIINGANKDIARTLVQLPYAQGPDFRKFDDQFNRVERNMFGLLTIDEELRALLQFCGASGSISIEEGEERCAHTAPGAPGSDVSKALVKIKTLYHSRDALIFQTPVIRTLPGLHSFAEARRLSTSNFAKFGTEAYHDEFRKRLKTELGEQQKRIAARESDTRKLLGEATNLDTQAGFKDFKDRLRNKGFLEELLISTDPLSHPGNMPALLGAACRFEKQVHLEKASGEARELVIGTVLAVVPFLGEFAAANLLKAGATAAKAAGAIDKTAKVFFALSKAARVASLTAEVGSAVSSAVSAVKLDAKCDRLQDNEVILTHSNEPNAEADAREAHGAMLECREAAKEAAALAAFGTVMAARGLSKFAKEIGEIPKSLHHVDEVLAHLEKSHAVAAGRLLRKAGRKLAAEAKAAPALVPAALENGLELNHVAEEHEKVEETLAKKAEERVKAREREDRAALEGFDANPEAE